MSALAEALVAAQRRALAAVEKQYAAGKIDADDVYGQLADMGMTDAVDTSRLIAALDLIREYGATLPTEPRGNGARPDDNAATDAQLALIADLVQKHKLEPPDMPLTKADASAIITDMKAGSYDAAKWKVPF